MTILRTAAQQALEALRGYRREMSCHQPCDAEVALAAALEQLDEEKEWANIPKEFHDWWDADGLTQTNPFREDSPAYWAWEGWQARPLGPHPDTVRLAYLYSGTQTSSDALVNAEMKLLSGKTLTLEEARAAIDDAMSKPMKY